MAKILEKPKTMQAKAKLPEYRQPEPNRTETRQPEIGPGKLILVLGGARSGKSTFAQSLAQAQELPVTYLASALPIDEEMVRRIDKHRDSRPSLWTTVEAPYSADIEAVALCRDKQFVIWDCVTVFLTNLLLEAEEEGKDDAEIEELILQRFVTMLSCLEKCSGSLVVVANEVGLGIVPEYPLSRTFRDLAGRVNQLLAQKAHKVYFVIAGLPIEIKG